MPLYDTPLKTDKTNWLKQDRLLAWALFIVSCLLYANTLTHQFTLDDVMVLTENKFVTQGDIWSILSKDTFAGFFSSSENGQLVEGGRYRPLTLVIFTAIWSVTQTPWVFHAINVLMFALTVALINSLVLSFPIKAMENNKQKMLAALTALLFLVHPIHSEVINNIKALDDILSLFLAIWAWKALFKPLSSHQNRNRIAVVLLMFFALLSKESAVVIIPITGLSWWFFKKATVLRTLVVILPMVLSLVCYVLIRAVVIQSHSDVQFVPELMNNPFLFWNEDQWLALPWEQHYGTIIYVLGLYLSKVFLPLNLSHDYYPHAITVVDFTSGLVWVSVLIHALIIAYTFYGLWKRHIPAFALAIYLISLSLFSNVFFTIGTWMAERFLYIPSLGICLLLSWFFIQWLELNKPARFRRGAIYTCLVLLFMVASTQTLQRAPDWHDNLSLFEADIKKSAHSAKLNNALGGELTKKSQQQPLNNAALKKTQLQRALTYLNTAIQLHPTYAMPHLMKGNALHYLGQNQQALESYQQALQLKPGYPAALENSEKVKAIIKILQQQQEQDNKEQLAIELSQKGNHHQAISIFSELIDQNPSAKRLFFRGVAYAQSEKYQNALDDFKAAEKLTDNNDQQNMVRIWHALASTHQKLDQNQEALRYQQKIEAATEK